MNQKKFNNSGKYVLITVCCHEWNQDSRGITGVIIPGICENIISINLAQKSTSVFESTEAQCQKEQLL